MGILLVIHRWPALIPWGRRLLFQTVGIFLMATVWTAPVISAQSPPPDSEATEAYKITSQTLVQLQQVGVSLAVQQGLTPWINRVFSSRESFLKSLQSLSPPPTEEETRAILSQAILNKFQIRSEEFSGNLTEGEIVFKGNVVGAIPLKGIHFWTAKLRLFRENQQPDDYQKLIAEGNVKIQRGSRTVQADYAIYHRQQQQLQLKGNIQIQFEQGTITGNIAQVDLSKETASLQGDARTQGDGRVQMLLQLPPSGTTASTPLPDTPPQQLTIRAQRAAVDHQKREAVFEGQVELRRKFPPLYLKGGKIQLKLGTDDQLREAHAEQSVCLEQPGRVARADRADFDEARQKVLLEGHAEVHAGQYSLKGNSIQLFLDVRKGMAQGGSKSPIEVTIAKNTDKPFTCQ